MTDQPGFTLDPRVSLITLGVHDLPRVAHFYEALGWRRSQVGGEDIAFFQMGGMVLGVWSRDALAEDAAVSAEGSGFRGVSLAYNVRNSADVDAALAAVEVAGGTITRPAQDAFWGGRTGYFTDPDGNLWEIAWNPGFTLDRSGGVHLPDDPQAAVD